MTSISYTRCFAQTSDRTDDAVQSVTSSLVPKVRNGAGAGSRASVRDSNGSGDYSSGSGSTWTDNAFGRLTFNRALKPFVESLATARGHTLVGESLLGGTEAETVALGWLNDSF